MTPPATRKWHRRPRHPIPRSAEGGRAKSGNMSGNHRSICAARADKLSGVYISTPSSQTLAADGSSTRRSLTHREQPDPRHPRRGESDDRRPLERVAMTQRGTKRRQPQGARQQPPPHSLAIRRRVGDQAHQAEAGVVQSDAVATESVDSSVISSSGTVAATMEDTNRLQAAPPPFGEPAERPVHERT